MEDVHLAADLVDLVHVVAGPAQLRLDERAAQVDGGAGGAGAEIVGRLLEGPHADGGTERLPARLQRLLGGQRAQQQRDAADADLAGGQLVDLDGLPIRLRLVDEEDPLACLPGSLDAHAHPQLLKLCLCVQRDNP